MKELLIRIKIWLGLDRLFSKKEKVFFELWDRKHLRGSLDCKEGWCGAREGYFADTVPVNCPCGGVIHGEWEAWSINEELGPYDEFKCDKCGKKYISSDVAKMHKKQFGV